MRTPASTTTRTTPNTRLRARAHLHRAFRKPSRPSLILIEFLVLPPRFLLMLLRLQLVLPFTVKMSCLVLPGVLVLMPPALPVRRPLVRPTVVVLLLLLSTITHSRCTMMFTAPSPTTTTGLALLALTIQRMHLSMLRAFHPLYHVLHLALRAQPSSQQHIMQRLPLASAPRCITPTPAVVARPRLLASSSSRRSTLRGLLGQSHTRPRTVTASARPASVDRSHASEYTQPRWRDQCPGR